MKKMNALVKKYSKPGIWLDEVPIPEYASNDVLIKIEKTAICGTDIHIYNWDEWASKTSPVPMVVGHEYVGVVEAFGENVRDVKVGELVSGEGHITCGHCRNCRAGRRHLCPNTLGVGVNRPGCFAESGARCHRNLAVAETDGRGIGLNSIAAFQWRVVWLVGRVIRPSRS